MSQPEVYQGLLSAKDHRPATVPDNGPLYAALAKAQKDFKPIVRSKTVLVRSEKGNYTFAYAPLESVLDATREALTTNELAFFQQLGHEGGELRLTTTLGHSSGCKVYSSVTIPQTKRYKDGPEQPKTAQEIGSAVTYMRRYMAQCILGVNAEEDDDGAQGEDMPGDTKPREQARTAPTPPKVERPKPAQQSAPPKPQEPKAPAEERTAPLPGVDMAEQQRRQEEYGLAKANDAASVADAIKARQDALPEAPPSQPPPANGEGAKPSKELMKTMREKIHQYGTSGLVKFNDKPIHQAVPEWCQAVLGVLPPAITLEAQIHTLIADLEQRKAAQP